MLLTREIIQCSMLQVLRDKDKQLVFNWCELRSKVVDDSFDDTDSDEAAALRVHADEATFNHYRL